MSGFRQDLELGTEQPAILRWLSFPTDHWELKTYNLVHA